MSIKNTNINHKETGSRSLNVALTTLACILAGIFPAYTSAKSIYGCEIGFFSNDNANGCSASVGLNQNVDGYVRGGFSHKGSANKNRVNIAHSANISEFVTGGSSVKKEANHNQVLIGNNVQINEGVTGGSSSESHAIFNAVRIGANAIIKGSVTGGIASFPAVDEAWRNNIEIDSSSNSVHVGDNSVVMESVSGGLGGMLSSFNEVYIGNNVRVGPKLPDDQLVLGGIVSGGSAGTNVDYAHSVANSNIVHIGDDFIAGQVIGGDSSKESSIKPENTANGNRVTIGDRSKMAVAVAARGSNEATLTKNELTVGKDANINLVYGGHAWLGNVSENQVAVGANLKADHVIGGLAQSIIGTESYTDNNTVVLGNNATVKGDVVGGQSHTRANGNTIVVYKGFNIGSIVGGMAREETSNNTVTLLGSGKVAGVLYGGSSEKKGVGNTLNLGSSNEPVEMNSLSAGKVGYFDTYNFYLPSNTRHNDTVLKLLGIENSWDIDVVLNLGNAAINAYVPGDANLKAGDVVHLIQANPGREFQWTGKGRVYQGITLTHDLAGIALDGESKNLDLTFRRNNIQNNANNSNNNNSNNNNSSNGNTNMNPQTKSLLQGRLVAPALINGGADYLSTGVDSLYENTNLDKNKTSTGSNSFTHVRADNRDVTTGSHVKLKGVAFDVGHAWNKSFGMGNLMYGFAAEYGNTRYTSHLDDGTKGKGKAWYLGANIFSNYLWNNGLYVQGSLRSGRVSGDYRSNDFVHANGNSVSYNNDSNYIAGHIGMGKIWQLGNQNTFDTYIKYFDSHTSSSKAKLSSGETYHFASVRSQRSRIGMQYNHNIDKLNLHFGLAHEREWNGDVRAQYQGHSLPSPTMKGGTAVGEAGVDYQLGGKQLNTALQAFSGRQRGVGLRLGMKF